MILVHPRNLAPVLLTQIYAPSGHGAAEERSLFFEMLEAEISAQGFDRHIVCGDFNEDVALNACAVRLQTCRGWTLPLLVNQDHMPCQGTLHRQHDTWIDSFLLGSALENTHMAQVACPTLEHHHDMLELSVPWTCQQECARVNHPPRFVALCQLIESVEWGEVYDSVHATLSQSGADDLQDHLEHAWVLWQEAVRVHLEPNAKFQGLYAVRDLGRCLFQWLPKMGVIPTQDGPQTRASR